jgi:hypothetical protein
MTYPIEIPVLINGDGGSRLWSHSFNEALPARIRHLLKLPGLKMEVLHISHWVLDRVLANGIMNTAKIGSSSLKTPPSTSSNRR